MGDEHGHSLTWGPLWWRRDPDFIIGRKDNPYLLRWFLIPRNPVFNIFMHKFLRDDDDRALHDHPWYFLSFMVRGSYSEMTDSGIRNRKAPSLALRKATHRHRVILKKDGHGKPIPCWTVILTGPRIREWGFWCPRGFVMWKDFTKPGDHGEVGKGCD